MFAEHILQPSAPEPYVSCSLRQALRTQHPVLKLKGRGAVTGDITAGPCSPGERETLCRLSAKYLDSGLFLRKGFLSFHSLIYLCYSGQSVVLTEICTHKKRLMKRKITFFFFLL